MLSRNYVVKPLMFGIEELDALMLGAKMVRSWGDKELAQSASQAIDKLTSVLPESLQQEISRTFLFSKTSKSEVKINIDFTSLRRAIRTKNKLHFVYKNAEGNTTARCVRPLCLIFFSPIWLLLTWCEKRNEFRNFRLDRVEELTILDEHFKDEKGKRLYDYCQQNGYSMDGK